VTDFSKLRLDSLPPDPMAWALAYAQVFEISPWGFDPKTRKRKPLTEHGIKDATRDPAQIKRWLKKFPSADIGVVLEPDLLVTDLDTKNGKNGRKDFERVTGLTIDSLNTPIATSPTGGAHLWFRANGIRFTAQTEIDGLGIDFCCNSKDGRCVIVPTPGSGRQWINPLTGPIMDVPPYFVDFMKRKGTKKASSGGPQPHQPFTGETARARRALNTACEALAKAGPGNRDSAIGKHVPRVGSLAAAGELDSEMALDELLEAAHRNPGADFKFFDKVKRAFALGLKSPAPQKTKAPRTGWVEHAMVDDTGQPLMNLANVLTAMRFTPELAGALAYDELLRAAVLTTPLPLTVQAHHASRDPLPRPILDEDVTQLQEWLQWNGLPKIGKEIVHQAIDRRAREFSFHRLREWLNGLKWDGKRRLNTWMARSLGAKHSRYHAAIGKMFLIAMAARVLEPGCKADYVLILEGPQGELKSEACHVLGGDYFSDNLPDIRSKDANQYVRGLWLIELPELSALSRADIEAWKAFITRSTERYRPFYGRREAIEPRQCLFVGTTNRQHYLRDDTGNRRFWPILVGAISLDKLKRDREQLFAEAVARYRAKEQWWPDRGFERKHIAGEQEARVEGDDWEGPIADHFDKYGYVDKVQICELGKEVLGFLSISQIGTADQNRIRRILTRLGWRRGKRINKARYWYRTALAAVGDGDAS
jgi:hypothetical protein